LKKIDKSLISKEPQSSPKYDAQWDERRARFSQGLLFHVLNELVIAVKSPLD
jgi:hypothetical protein